MMDTNKLWEAFVEEVRKDAFAAEIARGQKAPELGNFLGSVKHHKEMFKRAVKVISE
jgi:hypothetical protein